MAGRGRAGRGPGSPPLRPALSPSSRAERRFGGRSPAVLSSASLYRAPTEYLARWGGRPVGVGPSGERAAAGFRPARRPVCGLRGPHAGGFLGPAPETSLESSLHPGSPRPASWRGRPWRLEDAVSSPSAPKSPKSPGSGWAALQPLPVGVANPRSRGPPGGLVSAWDAFRGLPRDSWPQPNITSLPEPPSFPRGAPAYPPCPRPREAVSHAACSRRSGSVSRSLPCGPHPEGHESP